MGNEDTSSPWAEPSVQRAFASYWNSPPYKARIAQGAIPQTSSLSPSDVEILNRKACLDIPLDSAQLQEFMAGPIHPIFDREHWITGRLSMDTALEAMRPALRVLTELLTHDSSLSWFARVYYGHSMRTPCTAHLPPYLQTHAAQERKPASLQNVRDLLRQKAGHIKFTWAESSLSSNLATTCGNIPSLLTFLHAADPSLSTSTSLPESLPTRPCPVSEPTDPPPQSSSRSISTTEQEMRDSTQQARICASPSCSRTRSCTSWATRGGASCRCHLAPRCASTLTSTCPRRASRLCGVCLAGLRIRSWMGARRRVRGLLCWLGSRRRVLFWCRLGRWWACGGWGCGFVGRCGGGEALWTGMGMGRGEVWGGVWLGVRGYSRCFGMRALGRCGGGSGGLVSLMLTLRMMMRVWIRAGAVVELRCCWIQIQMQPQIQMQMQIQIQLLPNPIPVPILCNSTSPSGRRKRRRR
ncbi:hypothetical protein K491DRAFT_675808 [Lophiostoma macrostomum CBS 122681]|uniref:Uncharacterized protein n=1 Tax=Lophiostoma macrostomum CBS 122681 TaxID=1314788 RepID=A0A6A6TID2_9PLEO|nr:hypothetical protein K491DRAFT_675808 [Lophiostoma macrostomum CBS 122681]